MSLLIDIALAALLILSGLFGLIGSWGLLRLRDPMQRLHAPDHDALRDEVATRYEARLKRIFEP